MNTEKILNNYLNAINAFNFKHVHEVMERLDWHWVSVDSEDGIPTIHDMKRMLNDIFSSMIKDISDNIEQGNTHYCAECGGFRITIDYLQSDDPLVMIDFIIESSNSDFDEDDFDEDDFDEDDFDEDDSNLNFVENNDISEYNKYDPAFIMNSDQLAKEIFRY